MMTSFVASPGHQHPQYCNNVIHSVYNHLKRSEGLLIESPTSTRLCLMILFRFCSYLCCLSMGDSYNFRLCFELPTECNSGAKQHCPTHSIVVRWGQNVVDCFYFFNFWGCIIATQIHWKILLVVNHMQFLSWIYLNVCETVCNRD